MKNIINKNKEALNTILIATLTLVIFGFSVSFAQNWSAPTATAPSGNTPPPLNLGSSTQTKIGGFNLGGSMKIAGSLEVNNSTTSPAANGLLVFGRSVFNGMVETDDDFCININGKTRCLSEVLDSSLVASCREIYSTMNSYNLSTNTSQFNSSAVDQKGWSVVDFGTTTNGTEACRSDSGCKVVIKFYNANSTLDRPYRTRVYNHKQFPNSQPGGEIYTNEFRKTGAYINGDNKQTQMFASFAGGHIAFWDDRTTSSNPSNVREQDKYKIVVRDTSSNYGVIMDVCTVSVESEEDVLGEE
jgi:hypothetical protein